MQIRAKFAGGATSESPLSNLVIYKQLPAPAVRPTLTWDDNNGWATLSWEAVAANTVPAGAGPVVYEYGLFAPGSAANAAPVGGWQIASNPTGQGTTASPFELTLRPSPAGDYIARVRATTALSTSATSEPSQDSTQAAIGELCCSCRCSFFEC